MPQGVNRPTISTAQRLARGKPARLLLCNFLLGHYRNYVRIAKSFVTCKFPFAGYIISIIGRIMSTTFYVLPSPLTDFILPRMGRRTRKLKGIRLNYVDYIRSLLWILGEMRKGRRLTKAEMVEHLGVDVRTITRYLTTLRELGAPIEYDMDSNGHYLTDRRWRLDSGEFCGSAGPAIAGGIRRSNARKTET